MEPGQNVINSEVVDTTTPEIVNVAELISVSPAPQPQVQNIDDRADQTVVVPDIAVPEVIPAVEVKDLSDSTVENVDQNWTNKVREVIKEDKEQPYKEEEDSERLQEDYMKQRFDVDVDAPVKEK